MAGLLLLDLDNTLADREGAVLAWAQAKVQDWAPNERDAVAWLVEHDDDGIRPRHEFFSAVRKRFGLQESVDGLMAGYRRELRDALPAVADEIRPLESAWMIGDGEADIVGAHRAGIRSVWLHRGRTWPRSDLRPDHIGDGLSEALALLDRAR